MTTSNLTTPVALFCFNRPECTQQVFTRIAETKPAVLLLVQDGPRSGNPSDEGLCQSVRQIISAVDWHCDVRTNFAETNMGCRERVSSGLSWAFDSVPEAIILEDDCLPEPSFFRFAAEILEHYREDERVMVVSGANRNDFKPSARASYYFSNYAQIWGWASWRRAWKLYDKQMKVWPEAKRLGVLRDILGDDRQALQYWTTTFDLTHAGSINTWDYQLLFSAWMQSGLTIIPDRNLVMNIGFGESATHTTSDGPGLLPVKAMPFPLRHPHAVVRNTAADMYYQSTLYPPEPSLFERAFLKIKQLLG